MNDFDKDKILAIVFALIVSVTLIFIVSSIKGCVIRETEIYLNAGCEKVYFPGKSEPVWTNCKKKVEE